MGYGFGGRYFHAPLLAVAPEVDLLRLPLRPRTGRRRRLGTVTRFESRFERFEPEPGPPAAGGGTLLDFERWGAEPEERCGRLRRGDEGVVVPL